MLHEIQWGDSKFTINLHNFRYITIHKEHKQFNITMNLVGKSFSYKTDAKGVRKFEQDHHLLLGCCMCLKDQPGSYVDYTTGAGYLTSCLKDFYINPLVVSGVFHSAGLKCASIVIPFGDNDAVGVNLHREDYEQTLKYWVDLCNKRFWVLDR